MYRLSPHVLHHYLHPRVDSSVTCNSQLQFVNLDFDYTAYFCACGSNTINVPSTVYCVDLCYNLHTEFSQCNVLSFYDGFTSGSSSIFVQEDSCVAYRCNAQGILCTDDGFEAYTCDNMEHEEQGPSSTHSYVCNCAGPAAIPRIYQGTSGATEGSGCGGKGVGTGSTGTQESPTATAVHTSTTSTNSPVASSATSPAKNGSGLEFSISLRKALLGMFGVLLLLH